MKNAAVLTAASIAETEQKADPHSRPSRCLPDRNCGSKSQFPPNGPPRPIQIALATKSGFQILHF
jgi:hypothetical protein